MRDHINKYSAILIIICLVLLTISIIQNTQRDDRQFYYAENANDINLNNDEGFYYQSLVEMQAVGTANNYFGKVRSYKSYGVKQIKNVFAGDSIFDSIRWHELVPDANQVAVRSIGGEKIEGLTARMDTIKMLNPENLYIMIGINNVLATTNYEILIDEGLMERYEDLFIKIATELPDTSVYISSLLPVSESYINAQLINNNLIEINQHLQLLCEKYEFEYMDIYENFITDQNYLKKEYTIDSLHLNGIGEIVIWESLQPYYE